MIMARKIMKMNNDAVALACKEKEKHDENKSDYDFYQNDELRLRNRRWKKLILRQFIPDNCQLFKTLLA